ncbi:MAG: hypothetical protein R2844_13975 [Caldilineales bacterium]
MFIDKDAGRIELPNGLVITSALDRSGFEGSVFFHLVTPYDYGTPPFQLYRLEGGQLDGHMLTISVCSYGETLVSVHPSINFYPTTQPRWEDGTVEIQGQEKRFLDTLLLDALGDPHERVPTPGDSALGPDYALSYSYLWGNVVRIRRSSGFRFHRGHHIRLQAERRAERLT